MILWRIPCSRVTILSMCFILIIFENLMCFAYRIMAISEKKSEHDFHLAMYKLVTKSERSYFGDNALLLKLKLSSDVNVTNSIKHLTVWHSLRTSVTSIPWKSANKQRNTANNFIGAFWLSALMSRLWENIPHWLDHKTMPKNGSKIFSLIFIFC